MLQPLLIEIGVEELPAIPLLKELKNIDKKWLDILEENKLKADFEFYYTPRRLVLWHREFPTKQEDSVQEFFGAPVAIAFKDGEPTPAALGFAKKCGVDISELGRGEKGGKEVLYYKKEIAGRDAKELLNEMINKFVMSLSFGKSMRWGSLSESFIRPIRWLNVSFANELVACELFGVKASKITYPHRMISYDATKVEECASYFVALKEGGVVLYPKERESMILGGFSAIEAEHGLSIERDAELLDEVIAITENPKALIGSFDEKFLNVPDEVVITSMKEHQRYFPVYKDGKLTNKFVVVTNAISQDYALIIEGNEKVLHARLSDALFFWENDLKNGLSTKGLEKVVFMDGLGSMADKFSREANIVQKLFAANEEFVCKALGKDKDSLAELLLRASNLTKADLMSEMVYEFTELQGIMGYYYAKAANEDALVYTALKEQYLPDGEESELPSNIFSALIALSYKLDSLFGLFSIGKIPTGSRDPFALRRAVNGIVKIVNHYQLPFNLEKVFTLLKDEYKAFDTKTLKSFIFERIYQYYNANNSVIAAVLASGEKDLLEIEKKIEAVSNIVSGSDFKNVFSTFKRVSNITKDVVLEAELCVNATLFEKEEEKALYASFSTICQQTFAGYEEQLDALFALKPELDNFFDNVMVNAEDEAVKTNRKNLIASIYKEFRSVADIKEISV